MNRQIPSPPRVLSCQEECACYRFRHSDARSAKSRGFPFPRQPQPRANPAPARKASGAGGTPGHTHSTRTRWGKQGHAVGIVFSRTFSVTLQEAFVPSARRPPHLFLRTAPGAAYADSVYRQRLGTSSSFFFFSGKINNTTGPFRAHACVHTRVCIQPCAYTQRDTEAVCTCAWHTHLSVCPPHQGSGL